jgi:hypothetical protein
MAQSHQVINFDPRRFRTLFVTLLAGTLFGKLFIESAYVATE